MPAEMAAKLRAAVDRGDYATTSEVVREALRDWSGEEERRQAENARMRAILDKARSGRHYSADEVFAEAHRRIDNSVKRKARGQAA
ncbi:ribbon-helix-helix domain-containing protein [Erythrobacter sp.]|uniref:ribbon-helix-helix domain-containing protein n=1 Tax=Erythrobacter sp. TaxID=1042 RepID=UPI003FA5BCDD